MLFNNLQWTSKTTGSDCIVFWPDGPKYVTLQVNLAFASSFVGMYWRDDVMVKSPVDLSTVFCKFMTTTEKEILFHSYFLLQIHLACLFSIYSYQAANTQATWQITQQTTQRVFLQYRHRYLLGTFYQQHIPNILYIFKSKQKTSFQLFVIQISAY